MKKVSKLVATASLVLLTVGAIAQSMTNGVIKRTTGHVVKSSAIRRAIHRPTGTGTTNYAFIDYPISDTLMAASNLLSYIGEPTVNGFQYVQEMNMHYNVKDTGADGPNGPANAFLLHQCAVAFDTLLDCFSGNGYSSSTNNVVVVDSLDIPIVQGNKSGKNDTLIVQITTLGKYGIPSTKVLWADTLIQDTGFNGKGNSWLMGGDVLQLAPNLTLSGTTKFAVVLKYYDNTKMDTCGFFYGSVAYTCAAVGTNPLPDTTYFGGVIPVPGPSFRNKITANSFTTGYTYYTAANFNGPALTLPSTTYGDAFEYVECTPDTLPGMDWQDIAIFAEVSVTDTSTAGVNNITSDGLSIGQNFPNPYNKTTQINYSLTKSSDVVFSVCDITGREIIKNTYSEVTAGQHIISLSANQFTPGIYFYTFNVNGKAVTKKMVITE
ncbi:MAG: T9SS type A sorting domain-containing protein [Bacteroidia bacterium]